MVFFEYYNMLLEAIETTPRLATEVVSLYHSRLEFIANRHTIYLRPRGFKKNNEWAIGLYRMTAQEVEDVIKEGFDEDMKKSQEDALSGIIPVDTALIDPSDKGKEQIGYKRKDAEGPSAPPKKKKKKVTIVVPPEPAMTEDEYNLIASRIHEKMQEKFDAMQSSQDQLQSTLDK